MFRKIYHGSGSLTEYVRRNLRERACSISCRGEIPLWVKLLYTLFVAIFLQFHGGTNLLWFCHVAVLTTLVAVWLEDSLLASMQALAVFWPMVIWQLDFLVQLTTGKKIFWVGFTDFMFDPNRAFLNRAEYLHHIWLLYFLLWLLWRLGYHRRALLAQTFCTCVLLLVAYSLTTPAENVNWVYGFWMDAPQTRMPPWLWVALLMGFFALCWYLPLHFGFCKIFWQPKAAASSATEIVAKQPDLEAEVSTGG